MTSQIAARRFPCYQWSLILTVACLFWAVSPVFAATKLDELNFVNADVGVVLQALANATGTNILVAPDVKGTVNVRLRNVTVEEALKTIAVQAGFAYRLVDSTYIVSTPQAYDVAMATSDQASAVVAFKALSAADAPGLLSSFKTLQLKPEDSRLVIIGPAKDVQAAKSLLEEVDAMLAVTSGQPAQAATTRIITLTRMNTGDAKTALGLAYKDVTVEALQDGRLVLSGVPDRVDSAVAFLKANDQPLAPTPPSISQTYHIQSLTQADVVATLAAAFKDITVVSVPGNRLLLTGTEARVQEAVKFLATIDVPVVPQPNDPPITLLVTLKAMTPTEAIDALKPLYADVSATPVHDGSGVALSGPGNRVQAAKAFLSLIDVNGQPGVVVPPDEEVVATVALQTLTSDDAAGALLISYPKVRAKGLSGNRVVLAGPSKLVGEAKTFLAELDKPLAVTTKPVEGRTLVLNLPSLPQADAVAALGLVFPEIQPKPLSTGQLLLVGDPDRLKLAEDFLGKITTAPPAEDQYALVTLKAITPADYKSALDLAVKDVKMVVLGDGGVVISGAPGRLTEAKALLVKLEDGVVQTAPPTIDVKVVEIHYISAADVQGAISTAFPELKVNIANQRVVLSGPQERLAAAEKLITTLDVGKPIVVVPDTVSQVYHVKSLVPNQVKIFLEQRFGAEQLTVTYAPNRSTPDTAMSGVSGTPVSSSVADWQGPDLILNGPQPVIDKALAALVPLDKEIVQAQQRIHVERIYPTQAIEYLLQRYESRGLTVITAPMSMYAMYGATASSGAGTGTAQAPAPLVGTRVIRGSDGKLNVSEPLGDFYIYGPDDVVKEATADVLARDKEVEERVEKLVTLRYLRVDDAKKMLEDAFKAQGLSVLLGIGVIGSTPDVATTGATGLGSRATATATLPQDLSQIMLVGPGTLVQKAIGMLTTLDVQPLQIAINAQIVSVNTGEVNTMGVDWVGTSSGQITATMHEQPHADPLQIGRILRDPVSISSTIYALETQNKAKVISRPSTVVQNGQDGFLQSGETIYYSTISGYTPAGTPIVSSNSIAAGVTLHVRPHATVDGMITLDITTNVADTPTFRVDSQGIQQPDITGSSTSTSVQVADGQTLVIGGLIRTEQNETTQSVPVLGKIPLLGKLFTKHSSQPSESELLILVRPTIVKPGNEPTGPVVLTSPAN